jgi:hypothetical protein
MPMEAAKFSKSFIFFLPLFTFENDRNAVGFSTCYDRNCYRVIYVQNISLTIWQLHFMLFHKSFIIPRRQTDRQATEVIIVSCARGCPNKVKFYSNTQTLRGTMRPWRIWIRKLLVMEKKVDPTSEWNTNRSHDTRTRYHYHVHYGSVTL